MPSARELLEQADALMRRNRAGVIDTEIPELTEMVAMVALAPFVAPVAASPAPPAVLDDVPELTEAVEEIEIESIVELPEDLDESSGWLHHDHGELSVVGGGPTSVPSGLAKMGNAAVDAERERSPLTVVGKLGEAAPSSPVIGRAIETTLPTLVAENTVQPTPPTPVVPSVEAVAPAISKVADPLAATTDDWARWEVLADEIRMQVLQRVDIFTDTGLREQLSAQLQPIVDRASAEMVSTINAHVGGILRAYIAEAIEREIEKWRGAAR